MYLDTNFCMSPPVIAMQGKIEVIAKANRHENAYATAAENM